VRAQFVEAMTRVEPLSREAERQCAALARDGRWEDARPACEAAARVRCQVGDEFTSTEPTLGAGLSWPRVMAAVERAPFVCPAVPLLKRGARPRPRAQRQLELRAPALEVYVRGDLATARKLALGPPEDPALSDFLAGVERVENEFNTAVVNDDVVAQQRAVRDLLARELRFLPKGTVSRFSDRLRHQLTHAAYERGKDLADRKDWRAACRFWKEGLTFGRDDVDLLKAVTNVCTMRAHDVLRTADSCEALKGGLDFAVDGDGQRELLEGELDRHGCR
jgi:hypothetical protein